MKAKTLKSVLTKLNPLRNKSVPAIDAIQLHNGRIAFTNLLFEVEIYCDCSAMGVVDFEEVKRITGSLDAADDINFESDPERQAVHVLINNEKIGTLAMVCAMEDTPKFIADRYEFTDFLGTLDRDEFPYVKEALDYVTDDELRPAMTNVNFSETMEASDGHTLYFRKLKNAVKPFAKNRSYEPISDYERKLYIEEAKGEPVLPSDWELGNDGKYYKPKDEEVTAKIRKAELNFILDNVMGHLEFYGYIRQEEIKGHSSGLPMYALGDPYLVVKTPGMRIGIRMTEERFPYTKGVIPVRYSDLPYDQRKGARNEAEAEIDKKLFIKWLKTAMTFANSSTYQIRLKICDGKVGIGAEDLDSSKEFYKEIDANVSRFEFDENEKHIEEIGFNGKFLMKCVQKAKGDTFKIWMTAPNRAAIIDGYTLIMPVMLNEYV